MPQISLYIDEKTLKKIEVVASLENISLSKWVGSRIKEALDNNYPPKYFELFGSVKDDTLKEPEELYNSSDSTREEI
ncbi:MAG: toxin-antitoxin system, antitoxin component [Bacteroidetes bacterium]|nr:toxin-antitoxin system, antitoxin component [Bacteroidota bacterium]